MINETSSVSVDKTLKACNGSATDIKSGLPDMQPNFNLLATDLDQVKADHRILDSFLANNSEESLKNLYDNFSEDYESAYAAVDYEGPRNIARELSKAFPGEDRSNLRILDAGCGSGLVAAGCAELGFKCFVGIDLSTGMMEVARKKGIFEELKVQNLMKPLDFEDNSFDAVVSCGVFTKGHVKKEGLLELVRITRPGGFLVVASQEHVYRSESYPEFLDGLMKEGKIGDVSLIPSYSMKKTNTGMNILKVPVC